MSQKLIDKKLWVSIHDSRKIVLLEYDLNVIENWKGFFIYCDLHTYYYVHSTYVWSLFFINASLI